MDKNFYISVYNHTIQHCAKMNFLVYRPLKYSYNSNEFRYNNSLFNYNPSNEPAKILIENIDSFDMARRMNKEKILVLNLASDINPGGGVKKGSKAQEEDLYRKSNYFEANSQDLYPLTESEVVYSPLVHIIKDNSYELLPIPYPVSCLAVAALRNPKIKLENGRIMYFNNTDREVMQEKIDMIFKVAIKHGHKNLVLGALGCGAFNNPTEEVAYMFKNSLIKYSHYFERIGFAILSLPGNPNFAIFKNIISI